MLLDKGHIVAMGDPEDIADLHEESAVKRRKNKRRAKQLIKQGKASTMDVRKAKRDGTLLDLASEHGIEGQNRTTGEGADGSASAATVVDGQVVSANGSDSEATAVNGEAEPSEGKATSTKL